MRVPRLPLPRPLIRLHRYWMAESPGVREYVCAPNKGKVTEIVEATYGHPTGTLHLDIMEVAKSDLPPGATWLR